MLTSVEPVYLEFGRRLRAARLKARLTQEALGKRVGLSRTSITNIEQGNQHVGLHMLYALASAVGVRPLELLPEEAPAASATPSLDQVLAGIRRTDRAKVDREIRRLSDEDQTRVLRLVARKADMEPAHDPG
jgi:transcriptional regulator with XRE-family HTH domain